MEEFGRCSHSYTKLDVAVAWLGNPRNSEPFRLIRDIAPKTTIVAGVAFYQTHPEAIQWFINNGADIRIFRDSVAVFHPKIYLFRKRRRFALFVGSSNFTNSGFSMNQETNCLIEGTNDEDTSSNLVVVKELIESWRKDAVSFTPTDLWLRSYRTNYEKIASRQRKQSVPAPQIADEKISNASWIEVAKWATYFGKIAEVGNEHHRILKMAAQAIPIPWHRKMFNAIENRRIIAGYKNHGSFGHVGANGDFRRMLGNGTNNEQTTIIRSINAAARLQTPIPWDLLGRRLNSLVALGPTMKVWSRLLCLVRPDIYCTIASTSVRRNLSALFHIPQRKIIQVEGYMELLAAIHACPWFNSTRPNNADQKLAWERRVALLDPLLYE